MECLIEYLGYNDISYSDISNDKITVNCGDTETEITKSGLTYFNNIGGNEESFWFHKDLYKIPAVKEVMQKLIDKGREPS